MSFLFSEENRCEQIAPASHCSSFLTFLSASWGVVVTCDCYVCLATYNTPHTGMYLLVFTGYSEKQKAIDAGRHTISPPRLNRFSLMLRSWGHVTYLGSVFLWINEQKWVCSLWFVKQAICHSNWWRLSIYILLRFHLPLLCIFCVYKKC